MSLEILEKVKEFLVRLVKDQTFREQLTTDKIEQARKVMQDNGYNFSKEEFETATIEILELKERGEFHELNEGELAAAVGGYAKKPPFIQPLYGVIISEPPIKPIDPQPMYGIVIDPNDKIDPPMQAMYGVITSLE